MQTPISDPSPNNLTIDHLLEELVQQGGSDLHLAAGQAPYGRFNGACGRCGRSASVTRSAPG